LTNELPEGTVTVLFTDVVGSTELTTRLGDDAARDVLGGCDELVRQQVERHRGHEVKGTGDGLMVAFTSARRAVACAIDIQRAIFEQGRRDASRAVGVKIGLNTGEVVREEADLFGATVHAAARIAAEGDAGDILVSEGVKIVLGAGTTIELEDRGETQLKGFNEPWRLYSVRWREASGPGAPGTPGRTPYVGRDEERAELRRRLHETLAGRGSLVMIGGEPGVGKTRIAEELMAEASERGMLALIGHCYEQEGSPPYIPFVEMLEAAARIVDPDALRTALGDSAPEVAKLLPGLRKLFPDIAHPPELPPEQERRYLFNGMLAYLSRAAQAQPLLFVLDDLHWADDSTLLFMEQLAQHVPQQRLLIVGTYRDVELEVGRPLARTLEALLRQRLAHRISLRRLGEATVAAMLRALSGQEPPPVLVKVVYSETEGNPFFVEEVFQHLSEEGKLFDAQGRWRQDLEVSELDVPEGVRLVVGRRLERVGDGCRRALGAAAVIGRRFRYDLVEALAEVDPDELLDAIDYAEKAQLIVSEEGGPEAWFTFAHELIRQTLLSGMSMPRRQRMHLRVADAMERLYGASAHEHAADLAHHLFQAGAAADAKKTAHYLTLAADQAMASAAFEDALRLYEDAIQMMPADDAAARATLLHKRGLALRSVGRWDDSLADLHAAADAYETMGAGEELAQTLLELCMQLVWTGRPQEGLAAARKALDNISEQRSALRCRLLLSAGFTASSAGDHATAASLLPEALQIAEEEGDDQLLAQAVAYQAYFPFQYMRYPETVEAGKRAIELTRAAGDLWELAQALFITQLGLCFLGRFDEADHMEEEMAPLAERVGHLGALLGAGRARATIDSCRTGDFRSFAAFADADEELCKRAGMPWVSHCYSWRGLAHLWGGDVAAALERFEVAVTLDPPDVWHGGDSGFLAMGRAYGGDRKGALAIWRERAPSLEPGQARTVGAWVQILCQVEVFAILGERDEAAALYPLVLEAIPITMVRPLDMQPVHLIAGMAAAAGGQQDKAQEHYETALRQAAELPIVIAQPEVRRWYAHMLVDRDGPGDRERAAELLSEAIEMYRRLGMPKHVEMAEAMLVSGKQQVST
jgi:class 3 adenylate cyclase/tetratricopeptide (TPR) repeat protein